MRQSSSVLVTPQTKTSVNRRLPVYVDTLESRCLLSITALTPMSVGAATALSRLLSAAQLSNSAALLKASTTPRAPVVATPTRPTGRGQYLTSLTVASANVALADNTSWRFTAIGYDQFGRPMTLAPTMNWSVLNGGAGGSISADGLYKAPISGVGIDTVQVTAAGVSKTIPLTVTAAGIFSANTDVGLPAQAGHYSFNNGVYTVTGGGTDIWTTADQFNLASTSLTGDGFIVARVLGMQNTNTWAKAGVMIRETLNGGSRDAYVTMTPHNQVQFLNRLSTDAAAIDTGDAFGVAFPVWVKLVRQGNSFTGFSSPDGITWNPLGGAVNIAMSATVTIGLVVSSTNGGALNTATFDNVTVTSQPTTGLYRLTTRGQQSMALDVEGWNNSNGAPVSIYNANHTSNQQWLVQGQGDGTYKIYAFSGQNSLQMLDDNNGSTANSTPVTTWEDNGNSAQRWVFMPVGGGYYRIEPKNANGNLQTLEIVGGNGAGSGARTDIYSYWGGDNQVFKLDDPGAPLILNSPKKGLAGYPNEINNIHPSWFYTWGGDLPAGTPSNVEFMPMAWGYYGNANNNFSNWLNNYVIKQPGVKNLLAFNEPDSTSQSNLSVAQALEGYKIMAATGLPLGSPAAVHADNQWMRDFMAGAAAQGLRVDYVTIHWYGGADPNGFLNYVDYIHNLYNKPVMVTEFAPADWSGNHGVSTQQAYDFMRQVVPALNSRSYVARYSWFSAATNDAALGQGALFNPDGSLTSLGQLYSRM